MKTLFITLLLGINAIAQVGVNTTNPQGMFHVDGQANNPVNSAPNATQTTDDVIITTTGQVGLGTVTPHPSAAIDFGETNRGVYLPRESLLSINDLSDNPVEGLLVFNTYTSSIGDATDVVANTYYFFNGTFWEKILDETSLPEENETDVEIKKLQTTGDLSSSPITTISGPLEFILQSVSGDPAKLEFAVRPVGVYTTDISISKGAWRGIGNGQGGDKLNHVFNSLNWTNYFSLGILNPNLGQLVYLGIDYGTANPVFYVIYFQRIGDANSSGSLKSLIIKRY